MTTDKRVRWPSTEKITEILQDGYRNGKNTRQICVEKGWDVSTLQTIMKSRGVAIRSLYIGKVLTPNAIAPIDWADVSKRLRRKETVTDICKRLNIGTNTFRRHAKDAGFVINDHRPHKPPKEPQKPRLRIDLAKAQELLDLRWPTLRVAQKCGVTACTVGKYLREGVLKRPPPKEEPKVEKAIQEELKLPRVKMAAPPVIAKPIAYAAAPNLMQQRYIERLGGKDNAATFIRIAIGEKGIEYAAIEAWARARDIKIPTGQLVTIARGLASAGN